MGLKGLLGGDGQPRDIGPPEVCRDAGDLVDQGSALPSAIATGFKCRCDCIGAFWQRSIELCLQLRQPGAGGYGRVG